MGNKLGVALVKRVCPVCTEEVNAEIVMNQILTEKRAKDVEELNGKVVGMLDHPCEECKKAAPEGFYLIAIDPEKSGKEEHELWRVGKTIALKNDAVKRMLPDINMSRGYSYCREELIDQIMELAKP